MNRTGWLITVFVSISICARILIENELWLEPLAYVGVLGVVVVLYNFYPKEKKNE